MYVRRVQLRRRLSGVVTGALNHVGDREIKIGIRSDDTPDRSRPVPGPRRGSALPQPGGSRDPLYAAGKRRETNGRVGDHAGYVFAAQHEVGHEAGKIDFVEGRSQGSAVSGVRALCLSRTTLPASKAGKHHVDGDQQRVIPGRQVEHDSQRFVYNFPRERGTLFDHIRGQCGGRILERRVSAVKNVRSSPWASSGLPICKEISRVDALRLCRTLALRRRTI